MRGRRATQLTAVAVASAAVAVAADRLLAAPRTGQGDVTAELQARLAEAEQQRDRLGQARNADFRQMQAALAGKYKGNVNARDEEIARLKQVHAVNVGERNTMFGRLETDLMAARAKQKTAEGRLQAAEAKLQAAEAKLQAAGNRLTTAAIAGGAAQLAALKKYELLAEELGRVRDSLKQCEDRENVTLGQF